MDHPAYGVLPRLFPLVFHHVSADIIVRQANLADIFVEAHVGIAVERFLKLDHEAELLQWEERAACLLARLATIPGVKVRRDLPAIANHAPHVIVEWSVRDSRMTAEEVARRLLEDDPPIAILAAGERTLRIAVWTMQGDEHEFVADRLLALFR